MLPQFELQDDEYVTVELVKPSDYAKHPNQVAALTNRRVLYIKRKEFSKHPYALEHFPLGAWSSLMYRASLAFASMAAGITMIVFGVLIFYFRYTGELQESLSFQLALLMIGSGAVMALGVRRHRLALNVDGRTLRWKSPPLKFGAYLPAMQQLVELAVRRSIPVHGTPKSARDAELPYMKK